MLITSLALLSTMYPPKTTTVYYTCQMKSVAKFPRSEEHFSWFKNYPLLPKCSSCSGLLRSRSCSVTSERKSGMHDNFLISHPSPENQQHLIAVDAVPYPWSSPWRGLRSAKGQCPWASSSSSQFPNGAWFLQRREKAKRGALSRQGASGRSLKALPSWIPSRPLLSKSGGKESASTL